VLNWFKVQQCNAVQSLITESFQISHAKLSPEKFAELAGRVALARDRVAFGLLYDYFAPRLTTYLIRLNLERGLAEELAQEVMLVLWQKASLFDSSKSSLSTWLFRVARNRRIDLKRRDKSALLDPEDPVFQPEAPEPADSSMDARQRDARVRLAMTDLPEEQRAILTLAFFNGLSHSEIAERMELPLGTVKSRIRLAFARLRKAIEDDAKIDVD
jgi:RNA polymerase sigma-70 factor, ECF subfamily